MRIWLKKICCRCGSPRSGGFTLVETTLAIVVLAAMFIGMSYVLSNTTMQNIDVDISTTAIFLAREKMEQVKAKSFANIAAESSAPFSAPYQQYFSTVAVDYVNSADLDTAVGGPTDYKKITVTVTATGWNGNIRIRDLKSNL